ncbi:hypothetical protein IFM89_002969 [Coptis chinensis]|uniref:Uncharacterized protein n=1 Tax=Coptis chinensis TaxID=261450 RepID=A0A835IKQ1_9MAGN|nr:hypothetical protein IFM89_002969 [Coptis chinensis]
MPLLPAFRHLIFNFTSKQPKKPSHLILFFLNPKPFSQLFNHSPSSKLLFTPKDEATPISKSEKIGFQPIKEVPTES